MLKGVGLSAGIRMDFEGIATASAAAIAVKDRRRGQRVTTTGKEARHWQGIAVATSGTA